MKLFRRRQPQHLAAGALLAALVTVRRAARGNREAGAQLAVMHRTGLRSGRPIIKADNIKGERDQWRNTQHFALSPMKLLRTMKLLHRSQFLHFIAGAAALPAMRFAWAQAYPLR
jgi:hypothetical protein